MCYSMYEGQKAACGVGSFPPCGVQGWSSSQQASWKALLSAELSWALQTFKVKCYGILTLIDEII